MPYKQENGISVMCGITGFISTIFVHDQWDHTLKDMSQTMINRGPDNQGVWIDKNACIGLAHQRLSIIDLTQEGHQPMVSSSGRFVITYNYNL
jgi:asparagine synthase (glutamine-hydrolysing)